jgi:hypothetical protein
VEITIRASGFELSDQGRAYAEYRVFTAVSRFGGRGARLDIRLEACAPRPGFLCVAALHLDDGNRVLVRATGDPLSAAVDRGAARLARAAEGQHWPAPEAASRVVDS